VLLSHRVTPDGQEHAFPRGVESGWTPAWKQTEEVGFRYVDAAPILGNVDDLMFNSRGLSDFVHQR